jgi:hypothetical protein
VGLVRRLLASDRGEERRHREQIRWARRDVRWAKYGVALTAVGLAVSTVAWIQQDDGEPRRETPSGQPDSGTEPDEPLTIAVQTFKNRCDAWFVPRSVDQIDFDRPGELNTGPSEWPEHPAGQGGAPAAPAPMFFTVQGRSDFAVVLTDIKFHVVERRPAPSGVVLDDPCGDTGAFRWLGVDLDSDPPSVVSYFSQAAVDPADEIPPRRLEPVEFPYYVSASEPEVFTVTAYTLDCDCEWTIELFWQSEGEEGSVTIDDGGRPFRTVGLRNAVTSCSADGACMESLPDDYRDAGVLPSEGEGDESIPLNDPPR